LNNGNARFGRGCNSRIQRFKANKKGGYKGGPKGGMRWLENGSGYKGLMSVERMRKMFDNV
jgi:hypothetical protein